MSTDTKANMQIRRTFRVYPMWQEDVFKDIARIPERSRAGIREGSICAVSVNGHTKCLIVRGLEDTLYDRIMLDEHTRKALGVEDGGSYEFSVEETGIIGHVKWACTVSDRGYRISAWVGIISLALGMLGFILGCIGLWIALHPAR